MTRFPSPQGGATAFVTVFGDDLRFLPQLEDRVQLKTGEITTLDITMSEVSTVNLFISIIYIFFV